jgi:hypothetical protein
MNVQEVYELTLNLIDEAEDEDVLAERIPGLLRLLRAEIVRETGEHHNFAELSCMDDEVGLNYELCEGVVPFGLAAYLMLEEDPSRASFYQAKFEEGLTRYCKRRMSYIEEIEDWYSGVGFAA